MILRIGVTCLLCVAIQATAQAQTVRFTTNVGSYDMVLNPGNDPNLQPLVDNLLSYVGLGSYHMSAINRAADGDPANPNDDFVMQMGGFLAFPPIPNQFANYLTPVNQLSPVVTDGNNDGLVDFNTISNTRGTVSLALSTGNLNSGGSSFFVNLKDNSFLDSQGFVPFAFVEDMTTIDLILGLDQVDISTAVGSPGNLAFIDVPVTTDGRMVYVQGVSIVESADDFSFIGPISGALDLPYESSAGPAAPANFSASLELATVPEPSSLLLALLAGLAVCGVGVRRRLAS